MARPTIPVSDDRTDLAGLPPFWTKPYLSPPYSWDSWFGQFSLALGTKDNFNVSDILVEPGASHDDQPPRPESRPDPETQPEADDRLRRDGAARRRVDEANVERRKKGSHIGMNWFFHGTEARAILFFALANEGRKKLVQAFTHFPALSVYLSLLSFKIFFQNCVYAFKMEVNVTMERIKLYNSWYMETNESFLSFHSRLSAQAACCNWTEQEERSVFIAAQKF